MTSDWYIHTPPNAKFYKHIVLDYEYARRAPFRIEKRNKDKLARENERTFTQKHT